jgi:transposase-like protein
VSTNPSQVPDHRTNANCPACHSTSLTRGRLSPREHESVDLFACDDCGDFWFERDGTRLTTEAMRDLGVNP